MKSTIIILISIVLLGCNSNVEKKEIEWDKKKSIERNQRIALKEKLLDHYIYI